MMILEYGDLHLENISDDDLRQGKCTCNVKTADSAVNRNCKIDSYLWDWSKPPVGGWLL